MSDLPDDLRDTDDERYDLYVGKYWKVTPEVRDANGVIIEHAWDRYPLDTVHRGLPIDDVRLWSGGIMYLGLSWEEACRYERALREAQGAGILVPARYREPRISPEDGLDIALDEFNRVHDPDAVYGEVFVVDEYCCWRYGIPNLTAQARGMIPGVLFIYIHKLTGRVCSMKEVTAWVSAQGIRMGHVE